MEFELSPLYYSPLYPSFRVDFIGRLVYSQKILRPIIAGVEYDVEELKINFITKDREFKIAEKIQNVLYPNICYLKIPSFTKKEDVISSCFKKEDGKSDIIEVRGPPIATGENERFNLTNEFNNLLVAYGREIIQKNASMILKCDRNLCDKLDIAEIYKSKIDDPMQTKDYENEIRGLERTLDSITEILLNNED